MTRALASILLVACCLAGCAGASGDGRATSCEAIAVGVLPVRMAGRVPLVPARIDGVDAMLVLDTGADRLLLLEAALPRLKVAIDRHRTGRSSGITGTSQSFAATIENLSLGNAYLGRREADVVPFHWPRDDAAPDGFLAGSILFIFDLDIDMPARQVTLYRARTCPEGGPPWRMPYTALPAGPVSPGHAHLAIRVQVDGQDFTATIDSGAETSVISRDAAARLGVTDAMLARDRAIDTYGFGPADAKAVARMHRFGQRRIGQRTEDRPVFAVTDLPAGAGDILLGEDWLLTHRVWLSYASGRVYIAP